MPTFEFTSPDGKTYEVNGPDGSTKEQAFAHLQGQIGGASQPEKPSSIVDAIRAIPGGLAQGVAGLVGLPGDISHLANVGLDKLTGSHVADTLDPLQVNSTNINNAVSKPFGGYYQPQTTTGRYAEKAASFAPALIGGEASLGSKLLGRVLAPAAGAQLAGSAVSADDHPLLHGAAEVGGALLGGGLASGARAIGGAITADAAPEVTANKYLATLLKNQGVGADEISQNGIVGKGQLGAEALGPNGVATLAALGRRSGTTGEALANALTTRSLGAPSRMMDDFTSAAGIDPRAAQGNFDNVLEAGQKRAQPLYEQANKANQNISSPAIDRILETPAGRKAMSQASSMMQNDQSLMGVRDPDLLEQAREGGTEIPWKGGVASGLKLRSLDYVKRALDDQISGAFRGGNKAEGGILVGLKNKLVGALDDADITARAGPNSTKPEGGLYAQARAAAGDYLGAKQAYEDGQAHILSTTVTPDDVAKYVAKLSPTATEAYKGGIANRVLVQAQNGRLSPRILSTPAVQDKLSTVLGADKADQFIQSVQSEASLAKTGARLAPGTGSITSDIGLMTGEQDNAANLAAGMHGARALGHAVQGNAFGAVGSGLAALRHFAPDLLKTGGMNADVRNQLGKLLMQSPEDLAAHVRDLPNQIPQKKSLGQLLMGSK